MRRKNMKRVNNIALIIILLFTLCSCNNNQIYLRQDTINLNYNNISAGDGQWLDNDAMCSTEHNFGFDLYVTDVKGKHKITSLSYSYDVQVNNGKLFYCDDGIVSGMNFFEYDLATDKSKKIASIDVERIYEYYVVDEILYVVTGEDDMLTKNIVCISLANGKQTAVAHGVFAYGIVNGKLNYITKKGNKYSIYEYDAERKQKSLRGSAELATTIEDSYDVNFTSEYITFVSNDQTAKKTVIYTYKFEDKSLINYEFKDTIRQFVAYDKYAFLCAEGKDEESASTEIIYSFNINEQAVEKIVELNSGNFLFVGSDDEVYISSINFDGVRRYSLDGNWENVILTE